jgi:hypothetical protein
MADWLQEIRKITEARSSLIADLASKQANALELNSQVAELSRGVEVWQLQSSSLACWQAHSSAGAAC